MTNGNQDPSLAEKRDRPTAVEMQRQMGRGGAWMLTLRVSERILGFLSTIIVARLLSPDDFGVFAIAFLVITFSEQLGTAGRDLSIIRIKDATPDQMNAAWTISLLSGLVLGTLVLLSAPLVAYVFNEPRAQILVVILSLQIFMSGMGNVGVVMFRKQLDFAKEYKFRIYAKFINVVARVALAFVLLNYWALVLAALITKFLTICLTYYVHAYRPHISFKKTREIWSFSSWVLMANIGNFLVQRGDRFFVANLGTTSTMGFYHMGAGVGNMAAVDLVGPLRAALEPAYSKLLGDPKELRDAYLNVLSVILIFCTGMSVGFSLIAEDFVTLFYGEKWRPAAGVASWIVIASSISVLTNSVRTVMLVAGYSRRIALLVWSRAAVLILSILIFLQFGEDILQIAAARTAAVFIVAPLSFFLIMQVLPVSIRDLWRISWRPSVAAFLMAVALIAIRNSIIEMPLAVALIVQATIGITTYVVTQYCLWRVAGQPAGPERAAVRLLKTEILPALTKALGSWHK